MNAAFAVPAGSKGDSHAIVTQFANIVVRMTGSNDFDSTRKMHSLRGGAAGLNRKQVVLMYRFFEGPSTFGGSESHSASSRGKTGLSFRKAEGVAAGSDTLLGGEG